MNIQETDKQICHNLVHDEYHPELPRYCGRAAYTVYQVIYDGYTATGGADPEVFRNYYCDACREKVIKALGAGYRLEPVAGVTDAGI